MVVLVFESGQSGQITASPPNTGDVARLVRDPAYRCAWGRHADHRNRGARPDRRDAPWWTPDDLPHALGERACELSTGPFEDAAEADRIMADPAGVPGVTNESRGAFPRPNVVSPRAVATCASCGEPEGRRPSEEVCGAGCRTVVVPARFHEGKHRADRGPRLRQMPQTRHDRWHAPHEMVDRRPSNPDRDEREAPAVQPGRAGCGWLWPGGRRCLGLVPDVAVVVRAEGV